MKHSGIVKIISVFVVQYRSRKTLCRHIFKVRSSRILPHSHDMPVLSMLSVHDRGNHNEFLSLGMIAGGRIEVGPAAFTSADALTVGLKENIYHFNLIIVLTASVNQRESFVNCYL